MKPAEILSIDVGSEIRTVCTTQIKGSWQLAAEIVRFAIRYGASEIDIAHSPRGFVARCPGMTCPSEHLQQVATALDVTQGDDDRHRAILALEEEGVQCLLWLAGSPDAEVRMVTRPASSATVLETRPGRSPRIETDAAADTGTGMEIQFRSPRFDLRRSRSWLALACRFAPVAVSVDGADLTQGFQDALFSVSLGRPLPGGLAITADGDVPHLWLLRHGVLATRAAIPGYPPFEASLELGGVTPEAATPDELRGTVNPHLPALVDRAMALVVDAVCEGPYVDPSRLTRLATIVLRSAHKGLQLDRIVGLEVFQSVNLARGARTQRSLEQLQGLADEDGAVLWSVPPETDLGRLPSDDRDVLVLTPEQHGLLADLVSCPVQRPEPKPRFVLGALASAAADSWRALKRRFSPDRAGRQLKDTEMLAAEQALLCVLEGVTSVADGEVLEPRLCAGLGRARRSGGLLLLHRNNPLVVEAVRVVETDDAWRYPALLAAVGEEAVLPPELRVRWRRSLLADGRK